MVARRLALECCAGVAARQEARVLHQRRHDAACGRHALGRWRSGSVQAAAFGMNTASSHEFEFEYGEFGVFKFMIIRRHSIQTHDNFAVKNHEFEYFHE